MKQRYYCRYKVIDASCGAWVDAGYLLQAKDVEQFHHYLDNLGWPFLKAWERVTCAVYNPKTMKDPRIIVEYCEES